jgi:CTP:molybdopterin cytidylyltransferase MocA
MLPEQVYLLAAGKGRRAGGPKAWRLVDGRSLLERQIGFLLTLFEPSSIAVTIQEAWRERVLNIHREIAWVAEDPDASPLAALKSLVAAAPLKSWAFVYHVDMPLWVPGLFEALDRRISAAEHEGFEALAPVCAGRKGHPVLLSPALAASLAALDPQKDRLDYWLRTRKEGGVEVPFGCIHENWNSPALKGHALGA